jgi:hypothetical protein
MGDTKVFPKICFNLIFYIGAHLRNHFVYNLYKESSCFTTFRICITIQLQRIFMFYYLLSHISIQLQQIFMF